ncbi:LPD1 domain-containing protein [Oceanobacillus kimchii]|uniref:Large polyvalent protein-associated domain-containing protein n=1 Tax=Oceanobacillus kimchii TaxID=746691 RepID=A0ABQ5TR94_9BACI|nr:LPD1 domain-containing protein [Oceanobacillus kimchii]GLO68254.1 hypothetical protein MACH08_40380 [Oceanobacillus kimchii]
MTVQINLFEVEENNITKDIRTDAQFNRKVSYDVGEKIGGARKDEFALIKAFEDNKSLKNLKSIEDYSVVTAAELVTKKLLFNTFSLENEQNKGTAPGIARIKQLLIQRIINVPKEDSSNGRESYLRAATFILKELDEILELDDLINWIYSMREHFRYENVDPSLAKRRVQESNNIINSDENNKEILAKAKKDKSFYIDVIDKSNKAKELRLSCLGDKFTNFFKNANSANTTMNNVLAKVKTWDDLIIPKKVNRKKSSNKPVWSREFPERADRIGGEISDVKNPEILMDKFGFRGVEFGHWANDDIATGHLFRSSEAFLDLRDILKMNHNYSISFNGTLAMAYGSRGRGSALAHYEPINRVINLTRDHGSLGVTAHEWFHGLDHWLNNISHQHKNGMTNYLSSIDDVGNSIPSIVDVFKVLMTSIKEGNSIIYINNTNTPNTTWRINNSIRDTYNSNDKNVEETLKELKIESDRRLQSHLLFITSIHNNKDREKKKEKAIKKFEREFKRIALAIAYLHEEETGERLDEIPFSTKNTRFYNNAIKLDRNNVGKYWSSNVELAARAFESYVQDKLTAAHRKNDYLVCGTHDPIAFPVKEERDRINDCFDLLFEQIRKSGLL